MPRGDNPLRQLRWKLRVYQEVQVLCKIARSACRDAQASAALMSSGSRYGKSRRIVSCGTPSASMPRMSVTRIRKPRIQGRPPHLPGSTVILSRSFTATDYFIVSGSTSAQFETALELECVRDYMIRLVFKPHQRTFSLEYLSPHSHAHRSAENSVPGTCKSAVRDRSRVDGAAWLGNRAHAPGP